MIDSYKAIFLPLDEIILNRFKGFVKDGQPLYNLKHSDVYINSNYFEVVTKESIIQIILRIFILILLSPLFLVTILFSVIFNKKKQIIKKLEALREDFFIKLFRKEKVLKTRTIKNENYNGVLEEDVPSFLDHCKEFFVKVIIYSYNEISSEQGLKIESLTHERIVAACKIISKLSDLGPILKSDNISLINSILIIKDLSEIDEAILLGFNPGNGYKRNVIVWGKSNYSYKGPFAELIWNATDRLIMLNHRINRYLIAQSNAFLTNDKVFFIEDHYDENLNQFIKSNLTWIRQRLAEKNAQLIYFPSFQSGEIKIDNGIIEFLRYRLPIFYSLTDKEITETVLLLIKKINPEEFYDSIKKELGLPFFKRPCLLRNIYGGFAENENKFTYSHISYKTEDDLIKFFNWYLDRFKIPDDSEGVYYQKAPPPVEYDADWYFGEHSKKESDELRMKIDTIKAEGNFGVLAEAIMYMLETIKEDRPDILNKVRPFIEQKKLLESKVVLSPLVVDKHCKIYLPDYGNIEVRMHALPKTLYLLFLKYPEGIRFKELYEHKSELLEIYNILTNKYDKEEIEKAIDDLVDMTNPSINQKCARVREAFRDIMDEHIAKFYYIDGFRGESKKILLPRNMIDIRF